MQKQDFSKLRANTGQALGVPVFTLYGADPAWPTPDLLHCESIPERARLHDWEIRPHRHAELGQVLYLDQGQAAIQVEGAITEVDGPVLQMIPAGCIHGFRFAPDVQGWILTLAAPLLARLAEQLGGLQAGLIQPGLYGLGADDHRHLRTLFDGLAEEYAHPAGGRDLMLQSLVGALAVWLARQASAGPAPATQPADRGAACLMRFGRLVELHFREHWTVERYAETLGVTSTHLNNLCRRLHGQTALAILHQRLLLEAKRNLIYTGLTVNQIADLLGFSEPSYFTRFFRRLTSTAPSAFRQGQRGAAE
ncbi:MAG: AraC family transcriptional regulator [Pseudomonas sp.]|jgi:AraC family transcriptional activator of pobA|nr:AraC family transcriptional regulator [Pseudomonadales bacterium]MAK86854.1 AraC family transcriptional regulator [Pseudomonas sp.]|tara:strand:- start:11684 stop:12607 length:924 start_codon:yes stop_codon:yes gene_type:complete